MADFKLVEIIDAIGKPLRSQMIVDGYRINTFGKLPEETANIVRNIVNLPIRDDDVFLGTFPKSGTHWGHEVISMLLAGKAENVPLTKAGGMLEVITAEELENQPSPRLLNCHFPLGLLPTQMKEKKTKIVLVLRNPKDVSVSFYYHHKGSKRMNYEGTFADHHRLFITGQLEFGDWFDWVLGWEKVIEKGAFNIHLVYFEDLKKNGVEEIRKLAKFLGVPENEDLFRAIKEKCHFEKLSVEKQYRPEIAERIFNPGFTMFRKGEIGDWKNHFTVAMNEEFDALFRERMKNSKLKFQFT